MVAINLLNWREKLRVIQNTRFYVASGVVAVICMLLTFVVYGVIGGMISAQQNDITYLTDQMKGVDEKIKELKDLQTQKDLLLERQKVIESLQDSRPFVVRLFDGIVRVIPDGIVLDEMSRKGNDLTLKGTSDSNATIAKMMANVQLLKWVKDAKLGELKSAKADKSSNTSNQGVAPARVTPNTAGARANTAQPTAEGQADNSRIGFQLIISLDALQAGG